MLSNSRMHIVTLFALAYFASPALTQAEDSTPPTHELRSSVGLEVPTARSGYSHALSLTHSLKLNDHFQFASKLATSNYDRFNLLFGFTYNFSLAGPYSYRNSTFVSLLGGGGVTLSLTRLSIVTTRFEALFGHRIPITESLLFTPHAGLSSTAGTGPSINVMPVSFTYSF